jgi:large subunit ribosomal protein L24
MAQKIRREDRVVVIRGRDRGKVGAVRQVKPREQRIVVEGVNVIKRHLRSLPNRPGGIVERESPIHWSKVKLICPACQKATRVGFRRLEDGRKVRYCKKCNANID